MLKGFFKWLNLSLVAFWRGLLLWVFLLGFAPNAYAIVSCGDAYQQCPVPATVTFTIEPYDATYGWYRCKDGGSPPYWTPNTIKSGLCTPCSSGVVPSSQNNYTCDAPDPLDDCSLSPWGDLSGNNNDDSCDCPINQVFDGFGSCVDPPPPPCDGGSAGFVQMDGSCTCNGAIASINDTQYCITSGTSGGDNGGGCPTGTTPTCSGDPVSCSCQSSNGDGDGDGETGGDTINNINNKVENINNSITNINNNISSVASSSAAAAASSAAGAASSATTASNTASIATSSQATQAAAQATQEAVELSNDKLDDIAAGVGAINNKLGEGIDTGDASSAFSTDFEPEEDALSGLGDSLTQEAETMNAENQSRAETLGGELKTALFGYLLPTISYSGSCDLPPLDFMGQSIPLSLCPYMFLFETLGNILFIFANIQAIFIFLRVFTGAGGN